MDRFTTLLLINIFLPSSQVIRVFPQHEQRVPLAELRGCPAPSGDTQSGHQAASAHQQVSRNHLHLLHYCLHDRLHLQRGRGGRQRGVRGRYRGILRPAQRHRVIEARGEHSAPVM